MGAPHVWWSFKLCFQAAYRQWRRISSVTTTTRLGRNTTGKLDRASSTGGNIIPFIEYALQGFKDGLDEQIQTIQAQQFHVHWINYVHSQVCVKDSPTDIRRRQVVFELAGKTEPVPIVQLRYISPKIAKAYAGKTDSTIRRDVSKLEALGLISRSLEGVEIRREPMSVFLSPALIEG